MAIRPMVPLIGQTFDRRAEQATPGASRPWLEFYRRTDLIDLLMPVEQS